MHAIAWGHRPRLTIEHTQVKTPLHAMPAARGRVRGCGDQYVVTPPANRAGIGSGRQAEEWGGH